MTSTGAKKTLIPRKMAEILNSAIASLNSMQEQLSKLAEVYKKKGYVLPKDFPDLSKPIAALTIPELEDENETAQVHLEEHLKEPFFDEYSLSKIENNLLELRLKAERKEVSLQNLAACPIFVAPSQIQMKRVDRCLNDDCNVKEPVFDVSELSAAGKLMLEAQKQGIPFEVLKFTPKNKFKGPLFVTPDSDTFQVKTVRQITRTPDTMYYDDESTQRERLAASPVLFERYIEGPPKENKVNSSPLMLLQSPEEPELEIIHKVVDGVLLSEILKEPESPELSDLMKSLKADA